MTGSAPSIRSTGSPAARSLPRRASYGVNVADVGWWKSARSMRPRSVASEAAREDHEVIEAFMVARAPPG